MKDTRYFIYARRSSDTEDLQALSIEQQLDALRELARLRCGRGDEGGVHCAV